MTLVMSFAILRIKYTRVEVLSKLKSCALIIFDGRVHSRQIMLRVRFILIVSNAILIR